MRSKMSTNGHPRTKEPRPSIVNQDKANSIQTSRHNQGPKPNTNLQLKGTNNSITMHSNITTIKATRLNTLSNTIRTTMLKDHQRINRIALKPSQTMVRIQTRPVVTTRTRPTTRERTKTNHNLTANSNSKEIPRNNQVTLLKIDFTSFWQTCWSTCTMARGRRSIAIITPRSLAFSMNRKRSKKWIGKIQWSI